MDPGSKLLLQVLDWSSQNFFSEAIKLIYIDQFDGISKGPCKHSKFDNVENYTDIFK